MEPGKCVSKVLWWLPWVFGPVTSRCAPSKVSTDGVSTSTKTLTITSHELSREKYLELQVMTSGLFSCVIAIRELGFDFGKMVKFWFPGERGCYKPAPVPVRHRPAPVHGGIPWLLSIIVLQNNMRPYHKTDFPPYHPQLGPYHTITPHLMFNSEHPILYQQKQL